MIINDVVTGIIAIVIAYLLGSVSGAYIITRLATGKDIRTLGSGNAGGNNVFEQINFKAAIPVVIIDVGKGALAVAIAYWLLDVPFRDMNIYIFLAGIATVVGHIWPVYLKFRGGNGLSATIGALAIIMPWELLIVIGLLLLLKLITRNLVLSTNLSLLTAPISAWFLERDWMYVIFCLVLIVVLVLNFLPTARAAVTKAGDSKTLQDELLRKNMS